MRGGSFRVKQPSVHVQRYPPRSERHFARLFAVVREYMDALRDNRFSYPAGIWVLVVWLSGERVWRVDWRVEGDDFSLAHVGA